MSGSVPITLGCDTMTSTSDSDSDNLKYRSYFNDHSPFMSRKIIRDFKKLCAISVINNTIMVGDMIEMGASPHTCDRYKRTALHFAASRGCTNVVTVLMRYGANPNAMDLFGNMPLHLAIISTSPSSSKVVHILLRNGANVHMVNSNSQTPLELIEAKLRQMYEPNENITPENREALEDMRMLRSAILYYMALQRPELDISSLEDRLHASIRCDDREDDTSINEVMAAVDRLSLEK